MGRVRALAILIVAVIGPALAGCDRPEDLFAKENAAAAEHTDFSAKVSAEEVIRSLLKDPEAATFGAEYVRDIKAPVVCGYVNAKNGFGGYSGATPFVVIGEGGVIEDDSNARRFARGWNKACVDKKTARR